VLAGVSIGLTAAFFACRLLRSLLFGVGPNDPLTFAVAPLVLVAVAAAACYLPALRAARIDPAITLRGD
jgi:ABC-type antimicrobial peptide transport system permease subunit